MLTGREMCLQCTSNSPSCVFSFKVEELIEVQEGATDVGLRGAMDLDQDQDPDLEGERGGTGIEATPVAAGQEAPGPGLRGAGELVDRRTGTIDRCSLRSLGARVWRSKKRMPLVHVYIQMLL